MKKAFSIILVGFIVLSVGVFFYPAPRTNVIHGLVKSGERVMSMKSSRKRIDWKKIWSSVTAGLSTLGLLSNLTGIKVKDLFKRRKHGRKIRRR